MCAQTFIPVHPIVVSSFKMLNCKLCQSHDGTMDKTKDHQSH